MNGPSLFKLHSWEEKKASICEIIRDALVLLQSEQSLPWVEDSPQIHSLNRELYKKFSKAVYKRRSFIDKPTYNGDNPPYKDDKERHPRENKKPDFQWNLTDHLADEEHSARSFVVECKCLGYRKKNRSWKLNQEYVTNGIGRFLNASHQYGKGDDSCGMIGYIQNREFEEIFQEVNSTIAQNTQITSSLPTPTQWNVDGITELKHELDRSFPVTPFLMHHFWVDLRSSYAENNR